MGSASHSNFAKTRHISAQADAQRIDEANENERGRNGAADGERDVDRFSESSDEEVGDVGDADAVAVEVLREEDVDAIGEVEDVLEEEDLATREEYDGDVSEDGAESDGSDGGGDEGGDPPQASRQAASSSTATPEAITPPLARAPAFTLRPRMAATCVLLVPGDEDANGLLAFERPKRVDAGEDSQPSDAP